VPNKVCVAVLDLYFRCIVAVLTTVLLLYHLKMLSGDWVWS